MKVSECHKKKMIRHSITGIRICSQCGYAAKSIEMKPVPKKAKKNS